MILNNTYSKIYKPFFSILFFFALIGQTSYGQALVDNPCSYPAGALWPLDAVCYSASTAGMSNLYNPGNCNSGNRDDGWAWFTGDGGIITITYDPDTRDAVLHVFSDDGSCSVVEVDCADAALSGGAETVTISTSIVGQIYLVRIQRYNSNQPMSGCLSVSSTNFGGGGSGGDGCGNADRISCGDPTLVGESSVANTNDAAAWDCLSPIATPGGNHYYVVQWTEATNDGVIRLNFTNVTDANDTYMEVLSLGNSCIANTCIDANQMTISTGLFGNSTNFIELSVVAGVADYYFVVDAQNDGIDSYDLAVTCFLTGLEADVTNGCTPIPASAPANQGNYQTWDNLEAPASANPAVLTGTYNICENLYIKNAGYEWLKSFDLTLGSCWINTSNYSPNGANTGYHSLCGSSTGTWTAELFGNVIEWAFIHPTATSCGDTTWGDGNDLGSNYSCALYTFCYDTEVDQTCSDPSGFNNSISATDDGVGGTSASGINPSNITLGKTSPTINSLPVTLAYFEAKKSENDGKYGVILNWRTMSEINNDYFTVEHSADGFHFEEVFQMKAAGNGTSNDINNYVGVHENPNNGINYYRLKQTDYDGVFEYFDIKVVDFSNFNNITIFPNPVKTNLAIQFSSNHNNSEYIVKIYDNRGKLIYNKNSIANKGINETQIKTKDFSNGLYILLIENDNHVHKVTFVKE